MRVPFIQWNSASCWYWGTTCEWPNEPCNCMIELYWRIAGPAYCVSAADIVSGWNDVFDAYIVGCTYQPCNTPPCSEGGQPSGPGSCTVTIGEETTSTWTTQVSIGAEGPVGAALISGLIEAGYSQGQTISASASGSREVNGCYCMRLLATQNVQVSYTMQVDSIYTWYEYFPSGYSGCCPGYRVNRECPPASYQGTGTRGMPNVTITPSEYPCETCPF